MISKLTRKILLRAKRLLTTQSITLPKKHVSGLISTLNHTMRPFRKCKKTKMRLENYKRETKKCVKLTPRSTTAPAP